MKYDVLLARSGSGGNYLSNEIFYRVFLIRAKHILSMLIGHFHLPILQYRKGEDFYPGLNSSVINIVKDRIKRGILSI